MTPRLRARREQADRVVDEATRWAVQDDLVCGLVLVGSYAHGHPSMGSDVDFVVLTTAPDRFVSRADWVNVLIEQARLIRTARWGRVTERRLRLRSGLHVDIAFTDPTWAELPLDPGTRRVLADGHRVLYDSAALLQRAVSALGAVSGQGGVSGGMGSVVCTSQLVLCRAVPADVDDVAALHGDPQVMRLIDNGRPVPIDVVRSRDLGWLTADYGPGCGYWIAVDRTTGQTVGWFGLRPLVERPGVIELGYRLSPTAWGRGLATEGASALVEHAFCTANAVMVLATTMTVNVASRRVMERAGLMLQRTYFEQWPDAIPGSELGDVEYALTRDEWRTRNHPGDNVDTQPDCLS